MLDYPGADMTSARYYRGVSYFYTGKSSEAREDFLQAMKLSSDPDTKQRIQEFLDRIGD
jgi:hypothetical protein